jgi:signal transduction histidine kinase
MRELELLNLIRSEWLEKSAEALARGSTPKEQLTDQLDQLFAAMARAIEVDDPSLLDPILSAWAGNLPQTDLEEKQSNLTQVFNQLLLVTQRVVRENLTDSQSVSVMSVLLPCFTYAFDHAAQYEIEMRVALISDKLEQARLSLERFDRTKSDFISVAAHELKTPLTLIDGYSAMLRDSAGPATGTEVNPIYLDGIQKGTERMRAIIDDMIDVSLIDNDLLKLNHQPTWLNRIFSILKIELSEVLLERNQKFLVNEFPGHNDMIFADTERLMQVFRNVLSNAIKYTPDGGKIVVDGRKLPGFIEVTIHDTGIGIAPEDQPFIFEKFGQTGKVSLHSSGKTKFKGGGPGLGLKIAKGIVEAHGGGIWVESERYDEKNCPGSTFHILLPVRSGAQDEKMAKLFAPLLQNRNQEGKVKITIE